MKLYIRNDWLSDTTEMNQDLVALSYEDIITWDPKSIMQRVDKLSSNRVYHKLDSVLRD